MHKSMWPQNTSIMPLNGASKGAINKLSSQPAPLLRPDHTLAPPFGKRKRSSSDAENDNIHANSQEQRPSPPFPTDPNALNRSPKRPNSGLNLSQSELEHKSPQMIPQQRQAHHSPARSRQSSPRPTQTAADKFVPLLRVSAETVAVAELYSNSTLQQQLHQAYARISGREWTYFVGSVEVVIGNGATAAKQGRCLPDGAGTPVTVHLNGEVLHLNEIHIDLGPSPDMALIHAVILYLPEPGAWEIFAVGGEAIVDNALVNMGSRREVHSGSVIQIGNTEMLFLLPGDGGSEEEEGDEVEDEEEQDQAASTQLHTSVESSQTSDKAAENSNPLLEVTTPKRTRQIPIGLTPASSKALNQSVFSSPGIDATPTTPGQQISSRIPLLPPDTKTGLEGLSPDEIVAGVDGITATNIGLIQYYDDRARDIKPPFSYSQLIGRAILASAEEQCTLAKIYEHIRDNYAYYRYASGGWQNSIRHNLSLSRCFEKVARRTDEPGKGMKWRIVPGKREEVIKRGFGRSPRKDTPKKKSPTKGKSPLKGARGKSSPRKADASSPLKQESGGDSGAGTTTATPAPSSPGVLTAGPFFESPYPTADREEHDDMAHQVVGEADDGDSSEGQPSQMNRKPNGNTLCVSTAIRRHARSNLDTPLYKPPPRELNPLSVNEGAPTGTPRQNHGVSSGMHLGSTMAFQTGATPLPTRPNPMLQPPSTAKLPSLMMELPSSPEGLIYRGRLVDENGLPLFGGMWSGMGGPFGAVDEAEADCAMQLLDLATSPLKGRANMSIGDPNGRSNANSRSLTVSGAHAGTSGTTFTPLRAANIGMQRSSSPPFGRRDRDSSPLGGNNNNGNIGGFGESPIKRDFSRHGRDEGKRTGDGPSKLQRDKDLVSTPSISAPSGRLGWFGGHGVPRSSPLRAILNHDQGTSQAREGGPPPASLFPRIGRPPIPFLPPASPGIRIGLAMKSNQERASEREREAETDQNSHRGHGFGPNGEGQTVEAPASESISTSNLTTTSLGPAPPPRFSKPMDKQGQQPPASLSVGMPVLPSVPISIAPPLGERSTLQRNPSMINDQAQQESTRLSSNENGYGTGEGSRMRVPTLPSASASAPIATVASTAMASRPLNNSAKAKEPAKPHEEEEEEEIDLAKGFVRIGSFHQTNR